jgi:hypothetical protein
MSADNFNGRSEVEVAMDDLLTWTSRLNSELAQRDLPTITLPERHAPIAPFFRDMIALVRMLTERVEHE